MKRSKNNNSHWPNISHKNVDIKRFLPPWHEAFLLGPNVRFTRTPENNINQYHNYSTGQKSKKVEHYNISNYLPEQSTKESLQSTSSLVNLKTQFMMNQDSIADQFKSQKTSYELHLVNKDNSHFEQKTQKEEVQLSSEETKITDTVSDTPYKMSQNRGTVSWLSDSAFFEGFSIPIPSIPLNNHQQQHVSNSLQLAEKSSTNTDLIPRIFKIPENAYDGGNTTTHQPTTPIIRKNPKKFATNSAHQESLSSEKMTTSITQGNAQKIDAEIQLYEKPCSSFLQEKSNISLQKITHEYLEKNAGLLENVLEEFGIKGEIVNVNPGPVVTLYEFEPAPGIKSSRVIGLADDIARSMSSLSARVAVIPKRNAIGIELPNDNRETVYLRQIIESRAFSYSKADLALCLGKTIGGESVIADLAKMPHILVAGTTGSGKSVAINTMIMSLLYRLRPDECRMIMVDPKMLELSVYDGIPHLLTPVVTDPKKAVMALKWAVREMEERYRKMSQLSVRNIKSYNERIIALDKQKSEECPNDDMRPMPYIVIIVDEMADLMMVAGKEIEGAIQRLAQMARAAGIHLIMATQRPSVDVITGTIKANFPIRISFQVTSKIDSRTILGEHGAEQLLGQGDMLYMSGGGRVQRVHGPLVSEIEIEKVVQHLKKQGCPEYLNTVTTDNSKDSTNIERESEAKKERYNLYEKATDLVINNQRCSTSFIQRRLQIGYNRAALLVERMEQEGLVSEADHVGKRHVFAKKSSSV
ncbi:cell division protein [Candidatus Liberibacter solanacearum]|uniref:Cell division protein FtsK n=1 Tax=Candidatus Liberibacter solanacearum TaxID=556287 RepID=A0A094ZZF3_9HYPH|nr:DNA translocase FtsK [Candidatus Liberibacter solanacearum]KGB27261.1 cell division protein [Candidatus Liberibacter solanacearum]KJZ80844.1 cell division protein [Candidatus Liberibacter solanacearum]KJZ81978.1 Cell division protein FtsK [Candidatus Liberibacter solanacearum]KQC49586.1 cell division protein [Candidatus Liberibacter solanacearum]